LGGKTDDQNLNSIEILVGNYLRIVANLKMSFVNFFAIPAPFQTDSKRSKNDKSQEKSTSTDALYYDSKGYPCTTLHPSLAKTLRY
jgi:hypothetical protein